MSLLSQGTKRDRLISFAISFLSIVLAGLIRLPMSNYPPMDLRWMTVILLAYWMRHPAVIAGTLIGSPVVDLIQAISSVFPPEPHNVYLFAGINTIALSASATITRSKVRFRRLHVGIVMTVFLVGLGGIGLLTNPSKQMIVFYAACVITGILACLKDSTLNHLPSRFILAWLVIYLPWTALVYLMKLDPASTAGSEDFVIRYILVPIPVYLLEILIASHLAHAFSCDVSNDQ
ncbi:hypothetical protein JW823_04060 [bacterium]|nr:hypothetical protein [candidate division CSSED10-310 bacterium]